ncbi:hypothetical protein OCHUTO_0164 [Orientia chuto str. Dubai]|uniref:Uncharacterized protein n=1 Tax=Orientia chuto str. Dubai TaxID=1359168 RepID=A0A0F3MRE1_9RICK|nr:hypothetical protein OCHUTO_0164 [Orientia chuto str. Dubai]
MTNFILKYIENANINIEAKFEQQGTFSSKSYVL